MRAPECHQAMRSRGGRAAQRNFMRGVTRCTEAAANLPDKEKRDNGLKKASEAEVRHEELKERGGNKVRR